MIAARHPEIELPEDRGDASRTPSDDVAGVLAVGRGDIGTLFVSMARRHPDGLDAGYLRLAHPRPPARAASARRCARRHCGWCRHRQPSRPCEKRRAVRRDRPRHDVLLHRSRWAGGVPGVCPRRWVGPTANCPSFRRFSAVCTRSSTRRPHRGSRSQRCASVVARSGCVPPDGVRDDRRNPSPRRRRGRWPVDGGVQAVDARLANAPAGQRLTYCFLDDDPVAVADSCGPPSRHGGNTPTSSRSSPRRSIRWCPISGIVMCHRSFECASA